MSLAERPEPSEKPAEPCDACERAVVKPDTGRFNAGCKRCEDRALAQAPKHHRDAFLGTA